VFPPRTRGRGCGGIEAVALSANRRRLRIGLAGCGGIARQYHLRALRDHPGVDLVAAADPSPVARGAAAELGGFDLHDDVAEMIGREDVDAVVVCAPTPAHAELAEAVAATDKHLYLEKPVGLDLVRAEAVRGALEARSATTAVGFNFRLNPAFVELRRRIEAGRAGEIRNLRCWHCEVARPEAMPAWKLRRETGGGVLLDLVSHSVDTARWLLADEVTGVESARLSSEVTEHDDARVELRMRHGARVELVASYVQGRKHRWEVEGSAGVLRADRWPARVVRRRRPAPAGPSSLATRLLALPIPRREPSFAAALDRFAAAVAGGEEAGLATIGDGVRSLEIVLEAERLARGRG
jgi:myo-inositol 2-dehydrogenase / D-chiro-inositol 1-dehydrogenase